MKRGYRNRPERSERSEQWSFDRKSVQLLGTVVGTLAGTLKGGSVADEAEGARG